MEKFEVTSYIVDWIVDNMGINTAKEFSKTVIPKYNRFWDLRASYDKTPTINECFEFIDKQYAIYKRDNAVQTHP